MSWLVLILVAPVVGGLAVGALMALVCICEEIYNGCMDLKKRILS